MSDPIIYCLIVLGITVFMVGCLIIDKYAPRVAAAAMLTVSIFFFCSGVALLVSGRAKAGLGSAIVTATFYGYFRRIRSRLPAPKAEPLVARDWMGHPIDRDKNA
jgi:hypothetical protein